MPLIEMCNLSKDYRLGEATVNALKDINLEIGKVEFIAVWGPSGSGKTTLLNMIGTIDEPSSGDLRIDGVRVEELSDNQRTELRNQAIGFVFQHFNLLPVLSALENVMLPLQIRGESQKTAKEKAIQRLIDVMENSRQRTQKLNVRARGANTLAEFIAPSRVKGRKLLMLDRNMWFIKPGLRKPVPISPRQKLLGGASNGDIASTNYSGDYTIANVIEEHVGREPCYQYELVSNKNTTYDRIHYWVSKKQHVGVKSHYFTINGKLFKTAEF